MIFLIEYDRTDCQIVSLRRFDDRDKAAAERLVREISLNRAGIEREVVLLEANDEKALNATHGRYFKNLEQILDSTYSDVERSQRSL